MPRYRTYDHRVKQLIIDSDDPNLFPRLRIPRSTALGWIRNGINDVVTIPALNHSNEILVTKISSLENQLEQTKQKQKLSSFVFTLFGFELQYTRLPSIEKKKMLVDAVNNACQAICLKTCLELIGLSSARFHHWKKKLATCSLDDQPSCPRVSPTKLTRIDIGKIKEMVTSPQYIHFSISSLSWLAKRSGEIFASPTTWSRVISDHNLKRPRKRQYPAKPKMGIRANYANQIWHIDMTVIKLVDGTRTFTQSIIDNYSRYVLAHFTSTDYGGIRTKNLIHVALEHAQELIGKRPRPMVMVDSGVENLNKHVDQLVFTGQIDRVIAQIDITFSNSMIECFFRRLKHGYLYLQKQSDFPTLKKHIDFYVNEHNCNIPHSALSGGTPLEVFTGQWNPKNIIELKETYQLAIQQRKTINLVSKCGSCLA